MPGASGKSKVSKATVLDASFNPTFSFQELSDTKLPEHLRQAISQPGGPQLPQPRGNDDAAVPEGREVNPWSDDENDDEDHCEENRAINLTRAFDPSARINDHGDPNRVRITDGRAAITKKVTADLDSDDEIIKTMKDEGQKDEVIRDRLIEEGRIRYNVKSISTRYARIRRAFHKAETENLDEDLTDWHQGDDENLAKARAKNEDQLQKAIEKAKEQYWYHVAEELHVQQRADGDEKIRFSKHACRDRGTAIENGTAEPVFELDPDQESRKVRHELRLLEISQTKARKQVEADAAAQEKARKEEAKAEHRGNVLLEHLTRQEQRAHREAAALEKKRQVENKRQELKSKRLRKLQEQAANRQLREKAARKREEDKENREQRAIAARREKKLQQQELKDRNIRIAKQQELERLEHKQKAKRVRETVTAIVRDEMRRALTAIMPPPAKTPKKSEVKKPKGKPGRPKRVYYNEQGEEVDKLGDPIRRYNLSGDDDEIVPVKTEKLAVKSPITKDGKIPDPRETLTPEKLRDIASKRGLDITGEKQELLDRLKAADDTLTYNELLQMMRKRGAAGRGKIADLRYRLAVDDASQSVDGDPVEAGSANIGLSNKRLRSPTPEEEVDTPKSMAASKPATKKAKHAGTNDDIDAAAGSKNDGELQLRFDVAMNDDLD